MSSEIILLEDEELVYSIVHSSYFRKVMYAPPSFSFPYPRRQLERLYTSCRNYAVNSILSNLHPLSQLQAPVTHLDCEHDQFYILARVTTEYDKATNSMPGNPNRNIQSFSVLSPQNLSHFPGNVIYGYYSHIDQPMIWYISPTDADTPQDTENRFFLTEMPEVLLDLDDLVQASTSAGTYSQITVHPWYNSDGGDSKLPLRPDCVICIDEINAASQEASESLRLPILVLHPAPHTICARVDFYGMGLNGPVTCNAKCKSRKSYLRLGTAKLMKPTGPKIAPKDAGRSS